MLGELPRDRRSERREATVAEIVAAAWELCRAHGLAGLSLREVAGKVGMQAPSLYSYFASKNAIYDAMFAQGCREWIEQESKLPRSGDLLTDLRTTAQFFMDFCTADPVRYQLLFQRTVPGFEPSPESFQLSVDSYEAMVARLASYGVTDPAHIDLFTAIGTGLTDQQISNDPGGDRWARLTGDAMEMFVRHVTAPSSARPMKAASPKKRRTQR